MPPPPAPSRPPTVLILGGLPSLARPLALYLSEPGAGPSAAPRAAFIRIVDRFSVAPPSTYLDKPFLRLLAENGPDGVVADATGTGAEAAVEGDASSSVSAHGPRTGEGKGQGVPIEYKQVNLSNPERHAEVYAPPKTWRGQDVDWAERGFEVVFDFTGEMAFDKSEINQISSTHSLSLALARSSLTHSPCPLPVRRAYIRLTYAFYEMRSLPSSSPGHAEDASSGDMRPDGVRGRWWHETLRGLGHLRAQGLNVGVVRAGAWYGPGSWAGEVLPRVVAGHVYKYLKEDMKFLYNADLRINTIHTTDLAQLLSLLSLHLLAKPSCAESYPASHLVDITSPFVLSPSGSSFLSLKRDKDKDKRSSLSDAHKTVPGVVPADQKVALPLFHAVDDGDATQEKIGRAVGDVWGIKVGYINSTVASLVQSFAKTDFTEMVEDVNEMHVEAWSKMLAASTPPIGSTPITPFLEEHAFRKLAICLDGSKARRVLGFKPAYPRIEVKELERIVKGFQEDGIWPR